MMLNGRKYGFNCRCRTGGGVALGRSDRRACTPKKPGLITAYSVFTKQTNRGPGPTRSSTQVVRLLRKGTGASAGLFRYEGLFIH